jgi:gluconolactonase
MNLIAIAVALCMQQSSPAGAPTAPSPTAPSPTTTPPAQTTPPAAPPLAAKWPRKDSEASEDIAGVVKKGTPIYKWSEGHNFTEGPACAPDGTVYFVDIPANEILRLDPMGAKSITTKSNATFGLYLAKDGTLYGAQANPGAITKIDPSTGAISVVCDKRAQPDEKTGTALGRLNDLVVDDDGGIWFTAPVLGRRREGAPPDAVYFVGKGASEAVEAISDAKLRGPNGINLSTDGKTLYVVPYLSLTIMAYPIEGPGKLGEGREFYKIPPGTRETIGGDGLTVDDKGNLYVAVPPRAAIFVISPEGKALGQIRFPERTSNCALGGKDGKTLFVTATSGVYAIDIENTRAR